MERLQVLAVEMKCAMENVLNEVEGSKQELVDVLEKYKINDGIANFIFEEFDYSLRDTKAGVRCVDGEVKFFIKHGECDVEYIERPYNFRLPSSRHLTYILSELL